MPVRYAALFACIFLTRTLFAAGDAPAADATRPLPKMKIVLVGDSTVHDKSGWGPGFARLLRPEATCVNLAQGGRSSKSFAAEGWWKRALAEKPDYVLIQFGHNDQPGKGPERETDPKTTYPAHLAKYVDEARAIGAKPIIVTSLTRRIFSGGKIQSNLTEYVEAAKKLAAEKKVPLLDLNARSIELCDEIGEEAAAKAFNPRTKDGTADRTHLSAKGQEIFGKMVAEELKKVAPQLGAYVQITTRQPG